MLLHRSDLNISAEIRRVLVFGNFANSAFCRLNSSLFASISMDFSGISRSISTSAIFSSNVSIFTMSSIFSNQILKRNSSKFRREHQHLLQFAEILPISRSMTPWKKPLFWGDGGVLTYVIQIFNLSTICRLGRGGRQEGFPRQAAREGKDEEAEDEDEGHLGGSPRWKLNDQGRTKIKKLNRLVLGCIKAKFCK